MQSEQATCFVYTKTLCLQGQQMVLRHLCWCILQNLWTKNGKEQLEKLAKTCPRQRMALSRMQIDERWHKCSSQATQYEWEVDGKLFSVGESGIQCVHRC